jgi:hypothetical protein
MKEESLYRVYYMAGTFKRYADESCLYLGVLRGGFQNNENISGKFTVRQANKLIKYSCGLLLQKEVIPESKL